MQEAPNGIKNGGDLETGLATSGQASATEPSSMGLPPAGIPTSTPTSTEPNTTESPSTRPPFSGTPSRSVAFQDPPKASAPGSRVNSKPGSAHPSPSHGNSRKQSRDEQAEEAIVRSQAPSQHSTKLVKSAAPSRTAVSSKNSPPSAAGKTTNENADTGSNKSISPSQRFTPNRHLTQAEIFSYKKTQLNSIKGEDFRDLFS